jgi:hypothetical protein
MIDLDFVSRKRALIRRGHPVGCNEERKHQTGGTRSGGGVVHEGFSMSVGQADG